MQAQVVQSPERMKADISRMHSTLASRKETKKEKGQRLQEMRGQNENCQLLLQSSEQGDAMITAINTELEKQRWVCRNLFGIKKDEKIIAQYTQVSFIISFPLHQNVLEAVHTGGDSAR